MFSGVKNYSFKFATRHNWSKPKLPWEQDFHELAQVELTLITGKMLSFGFQIYRLIMKEASIAENVFAFLAAVKVFIYAGGEFRIFYSQTICVGII